MPMQKIIHPGRRPPQDLIDGFKALKNVYSISCVVADSMERANVMKSYLRILDVKTKIIGPVVTVKLSPGDFVDGLDVIKVAQPGDVVIVDAFGDTETSIWGGLMSGLCKAKELAGAIIDGAMRDVDETRDIGFPVMAKAIVPRSTHSPYSNRYEPIEINAPVTCGGLIVKPGDIVVADEIGAVLIPTEDPDWAREILRKAQEQAEKEERTRRRIGEGKTVDELLAEFGRI